MSVRSQRKLAGHRSLFFSPRLEIERDVESSFARARKFLKRHDTASIRDLEKAGVTRGELRKLVARGVIKRFMPGIYTLAGWGEDVRTELSMACAYVPSGVICLSSALRFHGLTGRRPPKVWMWSDDRSLSHDSELLWIRFLHRNDFAVSRGIEEHEWGGAILRVYNDAKTVADCFKFRRMIDIDIAINALRNFRDLYPNRLEEVWHYALLNRVGRIIHPHL